MTHALTRSRTLFNPSPPRCPNAQQRALPPILLTSSVAVQTEETPVHALHLVQSGLRVHATADGEATRGDVGDGNLTT